MPEGPGLTASVRIAVAVAGAVASLGLTTGDASAGVAGTEGWLTSGTYTWTVPAGVFAAEFDGYGGSGGGSLGGQPGGRGGRVRAAFAVVPGEVYTITVGAAGQNSIGGVTTPGGFGGGGSGANGAANGGPAGSGGGASYVQTGGAAVLAAGGGGGGGDAGPGGDGGREIGGGGSNKALHGPAGGGTQTQGGAAGWSPGNVAIFGQDGGPLAGGDGATSNTGGGGGGGAGWFGGGGGSGGGSGGGGSSGVAPTLNAVDVLNQQGVRSGNGEVRLRYGTTDPIVFDARTPRPATPGQPYNYTFTLAAPRWPAADFILGPSSEALPPGLTLSLDGTIAGTTTQIGRYQLNVAAFSPGAVQSTPAELIVDTRPVTTGETYHVHAGGQLSEPSATGLLVNDSDGDGHTLSAAVHKPPAKGTLSLDPNGAFRYTPQPGASGWDSFYYRAADGLLDSVPQQVLVSIENRPPTVAGDSYSTPKATALDVGADRGLLAHASDSDGDSLIPALVTGPAHGTVSLNPNGSFTYTPATGYTGPDEFTFRVSDGTSTSASATVALTVFNRRPAAVPDTYSGWQDTTLSAGVGDGVLDNDSDPDGDTITAVLDDATAHWTVALRPDGSFDYTPNAGYTGPDSFTYHATDGSRASAPARVSLSVAAAAQSARNQAQGPDAGPAGAAPPSAAAPASPPRVVSVRAGAASVVLGISCPRTGPTRGTIRVRAVGRSRWRLTGAARFRCAAGESSKVRIPLRGRPRPGLRLAVTIISRGGAGATSGAQTRVTVRR